MPIKHSLLGIPWKDRSVSRPAHHAWGDADCLWNYRKVGVEMWNWCGTKVGQQKDMNQNVPRCNVDLSHVVEMVVEIYISQLHGIATSNSFDLPHHQTSLVPCSSRKWWTAQMRCHHPQYCARRCKKDLTFDGCLGYRSFSHRNGGQKSRFFFSGLTNDWNLGRCTNNTRGNGKQQEEEGEETETEETGQDFHFFETFFLTSKHELLTCFGHLRCCKLRKVPLPHLGFNLVSFFNGTFLTKKGDTHGVTHFFPGWNI